MSPMPVDKLAFIIVESSAEPDVIAALEALDIVHYTRFADVAGHGETGRKDGTAIFPGLNTVIMAAIAAERVSPMVEALHRVRDSFLVTPGLKIIVTDCVMY